MSMCGVGESLEAPWMYLAWVLGTLVSQRWRCLGRLSWQTSMLQVYSKQHGHDRSTRTLMVQTLVRA